MAKVTKPANAPATKSKVANSADNGNNVINGDGFNNQIYAQYGNDTVRAGGGQDFVDGGGDNDVLYGDAGNDTILGGLGRDVIWGGAGNDLLTGGTGTFNATTALATPDRAVDSFFFSFNEGLQSDTILGFEKGVDKIRIDARNDLAISYNNDTSIISYGIGKGALKSTIEVQGVRVEASDIASNVRVSVSTPAAPENTGPANPGTTPPSTPAAPENTGPANSGTTPPSASVNVKTGSDRASDSIIGTNDSDRIDGLGGNDSLYGAHGDDTIYGGAGADKIWGGHGSDYLVGGAAGKERDGAADVFFFEKSDGLQSDTIAGFETGLDKINLMLDVRNVDFYTLRYDEEMGRSVIRYDAINEQGWYIPGNGGYIYVNGVKLNSSDIISNVKGYDYSDPYPANPQLPFRDIVNTRTGSDRTNDSIVGTLANDQISGLGGNDSLYGNHGDDIIYGGNGADQIWGGHGNDVLIGGDAKNYKDGQSDTFYFMKSDGPATDVIYGFEAGIDKIRFVGMTKEEAFSSMGGTANGVSFTYNIGDGMRASIIFDGLSNYNIMDMKDFIFDIK